MKKLNKAMLGACVFVAGFAGLSLTANAGEHGQTTGQCTLKNVAADKVLYDDDCTIKETIKDDGEIIWDIKMGDAESFLFAGKDGEYMHGPEEVTFKDHGDTGVFKWGDFKLVVEQD